MKAHHRGNSYSEARMSLRAFSRLSTNTLDDVRRIGELLRQKQIKGSMLNHFDQDESHDPSVHNAPCYTMMD